SGIVVCSDRSFFPLKHVVMSNNDPVRINLILSWQLGSHHGRNGEYRFRSPAKQPHQLPNGITDLVTETESGLEQPVIQAMNGSRNFQHMGRKNLHGPHYQSVMRGPHVEHRGVVLDKATQSWKQ